VMMALCCLLVMNYYCMLVIQLCVQYCCSLSICIIANTNPRVVSPILSYGILVSFLPDFTQKFDLLQIYIYISYAMSKVLRNFISVKLGDLKKSDLHVRPNLHNIFRVTSIRSETKVLINTVLQNNKPFLLISRRLDLFSWTKSLNFLLRRIT